MSGPFLLATVAYAAAGVVLLTWLRPDPQLTARTLAAAATERPAGTENVTAAPDAAGGWDTAALRLGTTAMALTQVVMVGVMTMTAIHMRDHHHGLAATGLVIAVHIGAMYLPSPVTGRLADRRRLPGAGRWRRVPARRRRARGHRARLSVALLALALALLGLGWNLGLLGGTTLVTAAVPLAFRARTQGRVDLAVALAGATGGMASGMVTAATNYATLSLVGAALALVVVLVALRPVQPTHCQQFATALVPGRPSTLPSPRSLVGTVGATSTGARPRGLCLQSEET